EVAAHPSLARGTDDHGRQAIAALAPRVGHDRRRGDETHQLRHQRPEATAADRPSRPRVEDVEDELADRWDRRMERRGRAPALVPDTRDPRRLAARTQRHWPAV